MADPLPILIVDDDPDVRHSLAELLRDAGYQVTSLSSGDAALVHLCCSEPLPVLVLADMLLPGLNAWQLVAEMRRREKLAEIPFIAITGAPPGTEAALPGDQVIIRKPFDTDELLATIRNRIAGCAAAAQ